jgi:hypothetical protein
MNAAAASLGRQQQFSIVLCICLYWAVFVLAVNSPGFPRSVPSERKPIKQGGVPKVSEFGCFSLEKKNPLKLYKLQSTRKLVKIL